MDQKYGETQEFTCKYFDGRISLNNIALLFRSSNPRIPITFVFLRTAFNSVIQFSWKISVKKSIHYLNHCFSNKHSNKVVVYVSNSEIPSLNTHLIFGKWSSSGFVVAFNRIFSRIDFIWPRNYVIHIIYQKQPWKWHCWTLWLHSKVYRIRS